MAKHVTLIKKAIRGNDDAFIQFIHLYKVDLYKTALAYLKNENDALEAIQEVTYRAYKNIHKIKKAEYAKTWLIRIMIHYCMDQLKGKKRVILNDDIIKQIESHDNHMVLEIEQAMMKLDDRSREILTLMYFNDLKIKESAQVLDRPEGTIKTWLNQALKALRTHIEEKGGDTIV